MKNEREMSLSSSSPKLSPLGFQTQEGMFVPHISADLLSSCQWTVLGPGTWSVPVGTAFRYALPALDMENISFLLCSPINRWEVFYLQKPKQCYAEVAKLLVWIELGHLLHIQKKLVCYHVVPWALFSEGLCVGNGWNPAPFGHSTFWKLPPPRTSFHKEPLMHSRSEPVSFLPGPHPLTGKFKHLSLSSADVLFVWPLHSPTTEICLPASHSPCWETGFISTGSVLL